MKKSLFYKYQIRSSVKESFDNLPKGLCFAYSNGAPILINHKMYDFCYEITGMDLQNGEAFWKFLNNTDSKNIRRVLSNKNEITICLNESKYLSFKLDKINLDGNIVLELTGTDVTELYTLAKKLQKDNEELKELGERLKKYNKDVINITKKKEYLETKMRVHNEIGSVLVKSNYAIKNKEKDFKSEFDMWQNVISMLKLEIEPKIQDTPFDYFLDAAKSIGVNVKLNGELPNEKNVLKLMTIVSVEVLTNAVRHAGATEIEISILNEEKEYIIIYKNNGKKPDHKIIECGGLSGLRYKIESLGGSMKIECEPCFTLTATILKGAE